MHKDEFQCKLRMLTIKEGLSVFKRPDQYHFLYRTNDFDAALVMLVCPHPDQKNFAVNESDFNELADSDLVRFTWYGGDQLTDEAIILVATLREKFTSFRSYGGSAHRCRILRCKQVHDLRQGELI